MPLLSNYSRRALIFLNGLNKANARNEEYKS